MNESTGDNPKIKVLVDADVLLELFINRSGFVEDAEKLQQLLVDPKKSSWVEVYITSKCLRRIHYELGESDSNLGEDAVAHVEIMGVKKIPIDENLIQKARISSLRDFNSAEEVACANAMNLDAIITLNPHNFDGTNLQIWSVSELLKRVYLQKVYAEEKPIRNVSFWLNNQTDAVAQKLEWILMPLPAFSQLRSSGINDVHEVFEQVKTGLEQQGVDIPATARGAFRDLECEVGGLRLYAIAWVLPEISENPEWMLLITLSSQPKGKMPRSLQIKVCDETQQLLSQSLPDTSKAILYAQFIGNYNEKFWVTVIVEDEFIFEIPPFGFEEVVI